MHRAKASELDTSEGDDLIANLKAKYSESTDSSSTTTSKIINLLRRTESSGEFAAQIFKHETDYVLKPFSDLDLQYLRVD